jgi:hypothetical protein
MPARVRWFRTFAMNVSQIYDGDGEPVEMKIEIEKEAAKWRRPGVLLRSGESTTYR